ncbi:holo-ACP synthase [Thalassobacillus hwangdonensis]|uniref:Holo-[acyl-carrier-protein] synthase n=1 Tax=Thalassobacillus hwangdonensis TaxID=546108 RepID=A0ABW3L0K9_9BACI
MIKGIGLDIVELDRINKSIKRNERFLQRILTEEERGILADLHQEARRVEFVAGRFAAKEAFSKAAGTGIGKLSFRHINVLKNDQGAPILFAEGYEDTRIWVSITHGKDHAIAQVILEEK